MRVRGARAWAVAAALFVVTVSALAAAWPTATIVCIAGLVFVWLAIVPGRGLYLLFAILFFVPVTINVGLPVDPLTVVLLPLCLLALIGGVRRAFEKAKPGVRLYGLWWLYVAVTLSTLISWPGLTAAVVAARPYLTFGLVAWHVIAEAKLRPDVFQKGIRFLMWASLPMMALAIYQRVTGTWPILDQFGIRGFHSFVGQNRSAGLEGHPIIFGTFCMMMIVIAVAQRPKYWQLFAIANAIGLILSGSRSGWLATSLALIVWYLSRKRKITRRGIAAFYAAALALIVTVVLAPALTGGLIGEAVSRLTDQTALASAGARATRVDAAWSQISSTAKLFFFGNGPTGESQYFGQIGVGDGLAQTFDNSYIYVWINYGLIALAALAAGLIVVILTGHPVGRILLVAFAVQITFFDIVNWPAAFGVAIVALGFRVIPVSVGSSAPTIDEGGTLQDRYGTRSEGAELSGALSSRP